MQGMMQAFSWLLQQCCLRVPLYSTAASALLPETEAKQYKVLAVNIFMHKYSGRV